MYASTLINKSQKNIFVYDLVIYQQVTNYLHGKISILTGFILFSYTISMLGILKKLQGGWMRLRPWTQQTDLSTPSVQNTC